MTDDTDTFARIERAMPHIADALPGFTPDPSHVRSLEGPDGMTVLLMPAQPGRAWVIGHWPADGAMTGDPHRLRVLPPGADLPWITVSLDQEPATIAREIAEQFLPTYERVYRACLERLRANDAYRTRRRKLTRRVAAALRTQLPPEPGPEGPYAVPITQHLDQREITGYVSVRHDSTIDIDLHGLPIGIALPWLRSLLRITPPRPRLR